jgi:predicted transcriptional regulator
MKLSERLTFEMDRPTRVGLDDWARAEDRPKGYLVRRLVERSVQEWQAAAQAGGDGKREDRV